MRTAVYTDYGTPDVLRVVERDTPVPLDDEVLVEVHAASVNAYDWHFLTADVFLIRLMGGLLRPKNEKLGADIAGRVVAAGANAKRFRVGDDVFGTAKDGKGGFAQFVCARERGLQAKPANVSFEAAAAVPIAATTALQGLRDKGKIGSSSRVLVHGASGGVGTFAVQIAKSFGAHVTAVCSTRNVETALTCGADEVIDYTREDFAAGTRTYDVIFVANGTRTLSEYARCLEPNGICVLAGGGSTSMAKIVTGLLQARWMSRAGGKQFVSLMAKIQQADLAAIAELLESGAVRPTIDRRFALDDVADALRYVGTGHAAGKVVLTIA